MTGDAPPVLRVHATAVAFEARAILITGPSGAGKSSLALDLMALGCQLVADDQVILTREGDRITASCPATIRNMIEARGIGLLGAESVAKATLALVIDLGQAEEMRLPPRRETELLGLRFPRLHNVAGRAFPAAIVQYMLAGRRE